MSRGRSDQREAMSWYLQPHYLRFILYTRNNAKSGEGYDTAQIENMRFSHGLFRNRLHGTSWSPLSGASLAEVSFTAQFFLVLSVTFRNLIWSSSIYVTWLEINKSYVYTLYDFWMMMLNYCLRKLFTWLITKSKNEFEF